ncbi:MAG TPA: MFS transporter [Psychrobacter sp.]|uniref:Bcr/CflA family efflux transporter n=1 Tax=Psychrobacter pasteurii TaxID=1945520 RepID=A0A1R4ECP0_9GAMM|nr:multidrug effflux MFS transporter [Psychrobacter pasteurii]SJM36198.1 Bicyclomycin resistance protein [Psychrobacter pasteurii]HAO59155.1 MFS transporter [Psychrobacter sp.]HJH09592.1 multidrug effflux MFS transporter [Psychrobacter pasteurii]
MSNKQTTPVDKQPMPVAWIMMLGLIVAIGPLSIDMYLPALPTMAKDFGVSTAQISNSVPAYFMGLVFGQLIYGPLSDRIGRVKPLYFGMTLYVIASLICATTDSQYVLFAARTLQALGACVGAVVTRAAIRDTLPPRQMAKAFSIMVLVMGLAPILAPSLGAAFLRFFDWHAIFWFLAAFGVLNLFLTKFFFKETLTEENRNVRPLNTILSQYVDLLKDPSFGYPAVGAGLLMGSMFVYISAAPELLMDGYGLTESQFSLVFGVNAAGFIGLTQVNQFLTNRFRLISLLRFGATLQMISASCLLLLGIIYGSEAWLPLVLICIFFCISGLGLTQPNASAIALAFQKHRAGMASALQGSLMFCVGIFGGVLLNLFPVNPVFKLGVTMAILMSLGTFLVYRIDRSLNLDTAD